MSQYHRQWHFQLRYYNKRVTVSLALGLTLLLAIFSTTSSPSYLYAQQQQQQLQNGATTSTAVGVKITSPARGQQVPVGSLTISGISKVTVNSNDCTVYAIWDHLKPYQKVKPTGLGGTDDYSNWAFTYTSAYHLITNGTNQLTAKISCLASPSSSTTTVGSSSNLTKWYSINVTGVQVEATAAINQTNNNINAPTTTTGNSYASTPLLLPLPSTKYKSKSTHHDEG